MDSEGSSVSDSDTDDVNQELYLIFKYKRMGNLYTHLSSQGHSIVSFKAMQKFLIVGTDFGSVHVTDYLGNENKRYLNHDLSVRSIDVDSDSNYFVSCSDDGKIVVQNLYRNYQYKISRSSGVHSVAIDPFFNKEKRVFDGGGVELCLSRFNRFLFFVDVTENVISANKGKVYQIIWNHHFVAWSTAYRVSIFDTETNEIIAFIDNDPKLIARNYIYWKSDSELLVGCVNTVKIVQIRDRELVENYMDIPLPLKEGVITAMWEYKNLNICGISHFGDDIMILNFDGTSMPEIKIVDKDGVEYVTDLIDIKNWRYQKPENLQLHKSQDELFYFIVSPQDVVKFEPVIEEYLRKLLKKEDFHRSIDILIKFRSILNKRAIVNLGKDILIVLFTRLTEEEFISFISQFETIFDNNKIWEICFYQLAPDTKIHEYACDLPSILPTLSPLILNQIAQSALNHGDLDALHHITTTWPDESFDKQRFQNSLYEISSDPTLV